MKDSTVDHYIRQADKLEYGYQTYGGDASVAALRCFRGYHKDAHWSVYNGHWLTDIQMRILSILSRHAEHGEGLLKVRDLAAEARTTPGYASRVVLKLNAWGFVATISLRGRYGGLFVALRRIGDTLSHYADEARARIAASKLASAVRDLRRNFNVSSMVRTGTGRFVSRSLLPSTYGGNIEIRPLSRWEKQVLWERARLAIDDPEGEKEAAAPMTEQQALIDLGRYAPSTSRAAAHRDLADALGLPNSGHGRAPCSAHGDHAKPTMAWSFTNEGVLLLKCFAGCTFAEIRRAALG